MRHKILLCCLVGVGLLLASCSDDTSTEEEFGNWKERNDAALGQWAANSSYLKILTFTKNADAPNLTAADYIYVEKLATGDGTESPLYTDYVRVAYRGRYIPSASYPDGYTFDETFTGDFSTETAGTADMQVSNLVKGFSTALMNMHRGDHWRVHIPYALGYGEKTGSSRIENASNLVFDIALFDFWPQDDVRPSFK